MKYATRLVCTCDGLGVVVKRALLTSKLARRNRRRTNQNSSIFFQFRLKQGGGEAIALALSHPSPTIVTYMCFTMEKSTLLQSMLA